jgi:hypothetical protein
MQTSSPVAVRTLLLVVLASLMVLAGALLSSFRLGFAADLPTLFTSNGARVLLGAAAGAAFGVAAALRIQSGTLRPLADLQMAVAAALAAAGGLLAAKGRFGVAGVALFVAGAAVVGVAAWNLVGRLDRPRRWTNLVAAAVLLGAVGAAALVGSYGRARQDSIVPLALWLVGDLGRADALPALLVLLLSLSLAVGAALSRPASWPTLSLVALGLGLGATGPLPFAGTFAARAVGRLLARAGPAARIFASAAAGAAVVVAIDAVPRLLIGGYAFPFLVPAGMLALPVFLGWNRLRLRALAGRRAWPLEAGELLLIGILTALAASQALELTRVVRLLT